MKRAAVSAALFVALIAAGFLLGEGGTSAALELAALIALGPAIGRWWAVLIPVPVLPLLAGATDNGSSEDIRGFGPVAAFTLLFFVPFSMVIVALGVAGAKLVRRRRRARG